MSEHAWMTTETKDGKQKLDRPFFSTNPAYIAVHHEWNWEPVAYAHAVAEMTTHQLANQPPATSAPTTKDTGGEGNDV